MRISPSAIFLSVSAVRSLAFTLMATTSGVYAIREVGLDPLQLVLMGTVLEGAYLLFELPTGVLADGYSRRWSVIIGAFLGGGGFILWGAVPVFEMILVANVIWALAEAFTSGAWEAWITDEVGEAAAAPLYLRASQVRLVAGLIGLPLAIFFALMSLQLPFIIAGSILIAVGIFLVFAMGESFQPARGAGSGVLSVLRRTTRETVRAFTGRRLLLLLLVTAMLFGAASEGFDRLGVAIWLQQLTLPELAGLDPIAWFAVFGAGGTLIGLGVMEILRRRVDVVSERGIAIALIMVTAVLAVAMAVFGLSELFWLSLVAMWVARSMRTAYAPLFLAWINRELDPQIRATVISAFGQGDAVGQVSMGPIIGWIGVARSLSAAIVTSAAFLVPSIGIFAGTLARRGDGTEDASQ